MVSFFRGFLGQTFYILALVVLVCSAFSIRRNCWEQMVWNNRFISFILFICIYICYHQTIIVYLCDWLSFYYKTVDSWFSRVWWLSVFTKVLQKLSISSCAKSCVQFYSWLLQLIPTWLFIIHPNFFSVFIAYNRTFY